MRLNRRTSIRLTGVLLAAIVAAAHPGAWGSDAKDQQKLSAAKQLVQSILEEDARPKGGFFSRDPTFPAFPGQPIDDCATFSIVTSIEAQEPYFESAAKDVAVVPVKADLVMVRASHSGGKLAAHDGSLPSTCTFEYERWSESKQRFEKVSGFRARTHDEEFVRWGEPAPYSEVGPWIAIHERNRMVRFFVRVSVRPGRLHQLAPQFPVHHLAVHALSVFEQDNQRRKALLAIKQSDRDPAAQGRELRRDLERMRAQAVNSEWAIKKLREALASSQKS